MINDHLTSNQKLKKRIVVFQCTIFLYMVFRVLRMLPSGEFFLLSTLYDVIADGIFLPGHFPQAAHVHRSMTFSCDFQQHNSATAQQAQQVVFPIQVNLLTLLFFSSTFVSKMSPRKCAFSCDGKLVDHDSVNAVYFSRSTKEKA